MNDDVITERQVVPVRPLDEMPALKVFANALEDERREHPAKAMPKMRVLADGRTIVHLPEPDEGLALSVSRAVYVRVIFRLGSNVARVETVQNGSRAWRET